MWVKFFQALIRLYQITLSPWIGRSCRFVPTCSHYAMEAFERHGAVRGLYLTIRRLLRCHPLGSHGWDPVPEHFTWRYIKPKPPTDNRHDCC